MTDNRTIQLAAVPIGGKAGFIWNRLHGEREDICEALLEPSEAQSRRELLQARLRLIDDALDRLMSGSYGVCSDCGRVIENAMLEADPAWALCTSHEDEQSVDKSHSEIMPESLKPFGPSCFTPLTSALQ